MVEGLEGGGWWSEQFAALLDYCLLYMRIDLYLKLNNKHNLERVYFSLCFPPRAPMVWKYNINYNII